MAASALREIAGAVLTGAGETAKQYGASVIDDQRAARLEQIRVSARSEEAGAEREFRTSERISGQEHQVGMAEKKAESALDVAGAKQARVTAKSTTKNDDGTLTITYTDGSAEILDPRSGTRTKYGDEASANADTLKRDDARAEADKLFDDLYGGMFSKSQIDLDRFDGSKQLAKARIADMIMEGASDSDIIQFMIEKSIEGSTSKPLGPTTRGARKRAEAESALPSGMPNAADHKGRKITDDSTGTQYRSDGVTWSEV